MASTYPLEVVDAQRWAAAHKGLTGDQLKAAVSAQSWDESALPIASFANCPPATRGSRKLRSSPAH
jgi:hypothetical protein